MKIEEKWAEQFKDVGSLKDLVSAQQVTITNQSKKIAELEKELEKYKDSQGLVQISVPKEIDLNERDEEIIAKYELSKLKAQSFQRQLTSEECKMVDTYAKLLLQLSAGTKKKGTEAKSISTNDLMKSLSAVSDD